MAVTAVGGGASRVRRKVGWRFEHAPYPGSLLECVLKSHGALRSAGEPVRSLHHVRRSPTAALERHQAMIAAGWPRPTIADDNGARMPVPWISEESDTGAPLIGSIDAQRRTAAQDGWRCEVCGLAVSTKAWLVGAPRPITSGFTVTCEGPMHRRCLLLAAAKCPHLADPHRQPHMQVTYVTAEQRRGRNWATVIKGLEGLCTWWKPLSHVVAERWIDDSAPVLDDARCPASTASKLEP